MPSRRSAATPSRSPKARFVLTILFWSWLLNWASFHFTRLAFLTAAPPMVLVRDGKLQRANMRRALMSREELMQQLRESCGVDDLDHIHLAIMEGDGEISKEDA